MVPYNFCNNQELIEKKECKNHHHHHHHVLKILFQYCCNYIDNCFFIIYHSCIPMPNDRRLLQTLKYCNCNLYFVKNRN